MQDHSNNPEFQLALQFVTQTMCPVFLTGRAGTGKTTFLHYIRETSLKKMVVLAPTGVAAINAGGTTLHSFFQLPFGPFVPTSTYGWNIASPGYHDANSMLANIRFNKARRQLLQELELLVIDEVSMVRADMLDAVDTVLRHFRQQPLAPFGGLQVLFIGDLYQLPPVISDNEWQTLKNYYESPFFFDAKVVRQAQPVYIELKKIYRQKDERFIGILNNIRKNSASWEDIERLHDHYDPEFMPPRGERYITLTSHNIKADRLNQEELAKLRGPSHSYEATVTGEFNDKAYPAEKTLVLKEGAQVMLIKNDKGETRRYYNGKIGTVKTITGDDRLVLEFPDETDDLVLERETWKNIRFTYNREKDRVEEEELGEFRQYPIRLAWAITIHKSQGLTFEKAVIDAGASFAPGQVYVALSRLTGLEGLVLRSRITPYAISTDARVVAFTEDQAPEGAIGQQLEYEQLSFIGDTLRMAFQWSKLVEHLRAHCAGYAKLKIPDKEMAMISAGRWLDSVVGQEQTAVKFSRELDRLLGEAEGDGYRQLQQRVAAAADFFIKALESGLLGPLQQQIEKMRAKQKVKKYVQELQALRAAVIRKRQQVEDALQLVNGLQGGGDAGKVLERVLMRR
jgi:hypothetical protein